MIDSAGRMHEARVDGARTSQGPTEDDLGTALASNLKDEFLCFTDPSTPIVTKFFKKIDATAQLTRLTEAMQQILSLAQDIKDVVWT